MDFAELGQALAGADWGWASLSVTACLVGLFSRAARWYWLFPPGSNPPGILPGILIGYMANNVLPLRAGEVVRVFVVTRRWRAAGRPDALWLVVATLVVERVLDSLAVVLILVVLVLLIPVPAALQWAAAVLLAIDVVGIGVLVAATAAPDRMRGVVATLTGRWPGLERLALHAFDTALAGLDGIRARTHWLPLAAWTVVVCVVSALAAWTMLRAMHLDLPFVAGWTVIAFVGLGISVPSAPGYVGVFHAAAVLAVEAFGVPRAQALGYAILFHASQFAPITLAGWVALVREGVSLGEAAHRPPPGEEERASGRC